LVATESRLKENRGARTLRAASALLSTRPVPFEKKHAESARLRAVGLDPAMETKPRNQVALRVFNESQS
jgi:hypothetical protein